MSGAAPALRPFEVEAAPVDPMARQRAARFADREIALLAEQGNFERARVSLARRATAASADSDLYSDAIRLELSAAPSGAAWRAWASRALDAGVEVAGVLIALVPERELCAYLDEQDIGWAALGRQRAAAAARSLLRMRLQRQLRDDPPAALASTQEPALVDAAKNDRALRVLALGALAGAAWSEPAGVSAIAPLYAGHAVASRADSAAGDAGERHARALLADAARLQPAWSTAKPQSCPPPIERFVRLGPVADRAELQRIARELHADVRAQPGAYLRCALALAHGADGLAAWLIGALHDARAALDAADADAAHDAQDIEVAFAALRRQPLQRVWAFALALSIAALALTWPWHGLARAVTALAAVLWLPPLRRGLDAWLYRHALRPALLEAIALRGVPLAALCKQLRARPVARRRSLAELATRDLALAIVDAVASFGRSESGSRRIAAQKVRS